MPNGDTISPEAGVEPPKINGATFGCSVRSQHDERIQYACLSYCDQLHGFSKRMEAFEVSAVVTAKCCIWRIDETEERERNQDLACLTNVELACLKQHDRIMPRLRTAICMPDA